MCDAVAAMGRQIKELSPKEAAARGSLSMLMHLQRRGRLNERDRLCPNAAAFGQLETLQWLRANDCPLDENTPIEAAQNDHPDVFLWARMNGCPGHA